MKRIRFAQLGLGLLAALGLSSEALADGRNPGSLLLFPEFDNRDGIATILTVTNSNPSDDVNVHFIYVGRFASVPVGGAGAGTNGEPKEPETMQIDLNCEEFDRDRTLTPNDTITVITNNENPQQEQGFVYAYARGAPGDTNAGQAIGFDHLIGNLLAVNGFLAFEYSVNPVVYNAAVAEGALTDLDFGGAGDGVRDLNGSEYEFTAAQILVPRFLGQGDRLHSELILIGLSGGSEYTTTADFFVYNDDEDQFSAQYTFRCWAKVPLLAVSTVFGNQWLQDFSTDNIDKKLGKDLEYGWFRVDGRNAIAGACSIVDPAVYAVYIEIINDFAAADLPFETDTDEPFLPVVHNSGNRQDGHLLPRLLTGDNEENGCPF